jgi:hypothetical protein
LVGVKIQPEQGSANANELYPAVNHGVASQSVIVLSIEASFREYGTERFNNILKEICR